MIQEKSLAADVTFQPFYDPLIKGKPLSLLLRVLISVGVGASYLFLQYLSLPSYNHLTEFYCWGLAGIMVTALAGLYVAADVFRKTLYTIAHMEGGRNVYQRIKRDWLRDQWSVVFGLGMALSTTVVGISLGIPEAFLESRFATGVICLGFLMAGFCSGMGLHAVLSVIALYIKLAPYLPLNLDIRNEDGAGGLKALGDSLWIFGAITLAMGVCVAFYMYNLPWTNLDNLYSQALFNLWFSFPFVVTVSIILLPGLAVRRQVPRFKLQRTDELKREKAYVFSAFKKFNFGEDSDVIHEKRRLGNRLDEINTEMELLQRMRNSHIDRGGE